jgi:2-polyprenyl-3-methyl-5-hydroxy-6-metoxy-1,4-benzoquinol methylase
MLNQIINLTYTIEKQAAKAGRFYEFACGYYRDVVQKEAVLANICEDDHVLCIGGGICPFSAILFHQITGARVTVVDNNELCIPLAKQVIKRLGLGEKVRVLYKDGAGTDINFADYSVVHLALQVSPMEQVFSAVESQILPDTRLLVRRPKKQLNNAYSQATNAVLSCCPYATHSSRNIGSTVLYIKQHLSARVVA